MQVVDMEMQDVRLVCLPEHQFQESNVVSDGVDDRLSAQSESRFTGSDKACLGLGIRAGKQRNIVFLTNKLLRKKRHNPFCTALKFGRDAFG